MTVRWDHLLDRHWRNAGERERGSDRATDSVTRASIAGTLRAHKAQLGAGLFIHSFNFITGFESKRSQKA